jgi:hypothetical protein
MTFHHPLDSFAFGPEEIQYVVKAYDDALSALSLASRDDPATRLLAKKIIEIARTGERDPIKIRTRAIEKLGTSRVRCRTEKVNPQSAILRHRAI